MEVLDLSILMIIGAILSAYYVGEHEGRWVGCSWFVTTMSVGICVLTTTFGG